MANFCYTTNKSKENNKIINSPENTLVNCKNDPSSIIAGDEEGGAEE